MDVYHKVLLELNEATGGSGSKSVNFKDLVKKMGFHGNYNDIFERLNRESWIIETAKADFVTISHWGVAEAKKSLAGDGTAAQIELRRAVNKTVASAKELAGLLETFSAELSKDDFAPVEQKFHELQTLFAQTKGKLI
jgi:hypothetical protein